MSPTGGGHPPIERRRKVRLPGGSSRAPITLRGQARGRLAFDVVVLLLAMAASAIAAASSDGETGVGWRLLFAAVVLVGLAVSGSYRPRVTVDAVDDVRTIVGTTAVAALLVTFLRTLGADDLNAAEDALQAWLFAAIYLAAARSGFELARRRARLRGGGLVPTVIMGAGRVGQFLARRLLDHPEFGLRPVAFIDSSPLELDPRLEIPVVDLDSGPEGDSDERGRAMMRVLDEMAVGHLVVAFSREAHDAELNLIRGCSRRGISVSLVPRLFEGVPDQTSLERVGGVPLVSVFPSDPLGFAYLAKYAVDRILAAVGLLLLSPLLLLLAVGTLFSVGSPVLFKQRRVGMDGRYFDLLKFRTMRGEPVDEEEELVAGEEEELVAGEETELAPGGVEGEDRRTRFGRVLRRFSLDELPQLINVLRGEMSLVGPRPERVEFSDRFDEEVRRYVDRRRVRSGLTGWAQVNGLRGKTSLSDRVEWDNYYIENWSPWLDVKILFVTLWVVLRDRAE